MPINSPSSIAENLINIRAKIDLARACYQQKRQTDYPVNLVAVSKRQSEDRIAAALNAGIRVFGENRVQEAKSRWQHRRASYADLVLHLIGPLQTNKVSDAVALFDVIQVVDRPKLAQALAQEMARQNRQLECYVQVNTGEEKQKSGVAPNEVDQLVTYCRDDLGMAVTGLMCIPPVNEESAMHFALLATIAQRNELSKLSMGMSDDFEEAILLGATTVRVGSAIFGTRDSQ